MAASAASASKSAKDTSSSPSKAASVAELTDGISSLSVASASSSTPAPAASAATAPSATAAADGAAAASIVPVKVSPIAFTDADCHAGFVDKAIKSQRLFAGEMQLRGTFPPADCDIYRLTENYQRIGSEFFEGEYSGRLLMYLAYDAKQSKVRCAGYEMVSEDQILKAVKDMPIPQNDRDILNYGFETCGDAMICVVFTWVNDPSKARLLSLRFD